MVSPGGHQLLPSRRLGIILDYRVTADRPRRMADMRRLHNPFLPGSVSAMVQAISVPSPPAVTQQLFTAATQQLVQQPVQQLIQLLLKQLINRQSAD